jgi:ArsR family transcriptional regulator, arsenate/arsenite/antimonite-responsive transcriptional repressor
VGVELVLLPQGAPLGQLHVGHHIRIPTQVGEALPSPLFAPHTAVHQEQESDAYQRTVDEPFQAFLLLLTRAAPCRDPNSLTVQAGRQWDGCGLATFDSSNYIEVSKDGAMEEARLAKIFKALSNPNRLRLFEAIRTAERTSFKQGCGLRAVAERLSIGAPTVSHHLKELVNAGLVETEKRGKFLHCSIAQHAVDDVSAFFARS